MWFRILPAVAAIFLLTSCSRDPEVAKQRYLESGNRYFDKGAYREASIMYRNALKTDQKFGPAHYRLGLVALKDNQSSQAIGPLRRAVELLPPGSKERIDAQVKLADLYLSYMESQNYNADLASDVERTITELLSRNPNDFDGRRLRGILRFVRAQNTASGRLPGDVEEQVTAAFDDLRAANQAKPNDPRTATYLARGLSLRKQFGDAETIYKNLLAEHKDYIPGYLEWYRVLLFQNRPADAEQVLKKAIESNPKSPELLINLATHYYGQKRRDDVVKTIERLKSHASEYPKAYETAGQFYFRLGDGAEAIRQYEEGMRADSSSRRKYQKLIIEVLAAQGKKEEALKINDEILKSDPKDADALALQASLMLERGQLQEAINQLQAVVSQSPDNYQALFNLGRGLMAKGDVEQARQRFLEVLRVRQDHTPARLALGQIQLTKREFDSAIKTAEDILAYDPRNPGAYLVRSGAQIHLQQNAKAREGLETLLKINATNQDALFQMGLLNMIEKKHKDAETAYRKCYDLNPNSSRGLMGQVDAVVAQGQPDRALAILRQEIAKYPNRMDFHVALAGVAIRARNADLAISEYRWVLDRVDKNSQIAGDVYYRLSDVQRATGKVQEATESLENAYRILPNQTLIGNTLAAQYEAAGKKAEAKAIYEGILQRESDNAIALNNLANLIALTPGGDLDQALTYAQRAKQKAPTVLEIADTVGVIYLKKNLPDNAIEIFRDCVRKTPGHPTFRLHLAQALYQKGDKVKARDEARQALSAKPNKEDESGIRELLSKIGT